jgi:hypothetical protein
MKNIVIICVLVFFVMLVHVSQTEMVFENKNDTKSLEVEIFHLNEELQVLQHSTALQHQSINRLQY